MSSYTSHYTSSEISSEINNFSKMNKEGKGEIETKFGTHYVNVVVDSHEIRDIGGDDNAFEIIASGSIGIKGKPYTSSPGFTASIIGSTSWNNKGELELDIVSASDISLLGISKLHLNGIRHNVKDIIAMTLIENDKVSLTRITRDEGQNAKIWNY